MDKRVFNANKKMIIQEVEMFLNELKLHCESPSQLKYISNHYLTQTIADIKRVIKEAGVEEN